MESFVDGVSGLSARQDVRELHRWAKNASLHDAHEQLVLGRKYCWSGDAMRRQPNQRNGIDLFEQEDDQVVKMANMAFHSIWSASQVAPKRFFQQGSMVNNVMNFEAMTSLGKQSEQSQLFQLITRH